MDNLRKRWDALAKSDQQAILDKHREVNLYDGWHESIFENLIADVNQYGYLIDETYGKGGGHAIWFSGFYSQGDGACFDGRVWAWQIALAPWPELAKYIKDESVDKHLTWKSSGRYSHAHTLVFDNNLDLDNTYDPITDRLRWLAQNDLIESVTKQWEDFVEKTERHVISLCELLYNNLNDEYDDLISDEQVLESLIANEMLEDELKEYEDGECEESESTGPADQCADQPAAGPLLLGPLGDAPEAGGGLHSADTGCGRQEHLLQPRLCADADA